MNLKFKQENGLKKESAYAQCLKPPDGRGYLESP